MQKCIAYGFDWAMLILQDALLSALARDRRSCAQKTILDIKRPQPHIL